MKKIILFIASLLLATIVFSQETQDVVYLKNDSIIRGIIIEQVPNEQIKIKINNGSVFICKFSEIIKITKEVEEINLDEYGGKFSTGVAIGGGGIVGIPLRFYFTPKFAIEAGAYLRPVIKERQSYYSGYYDISAGVMVACGTIIYFQKYYKSHREKIKLNGILLKGGYSFSEAPDAFISLGWAHESFRKNNKNHSFIFELGFGVISSYIYSNSSEAMPLIYWKLHWNWYNK